jgi:hypothetical protein
MPRNSEIDRLVSDAEQKMRPWIFPPPSMLSDDAFYREHLRLSVLSPLSEVKARTDGRLVTFGGGGGLFKNAEPIVYDDDKAKPLIAAARSGDINADAVLSSIAAHHVRNGCALPLRLRDYISLKLDAVMITGEAFPKQRRVRRTRGNVKPNAKRDFIITWAVEELVRDGHKLGNSRAQHSASSIVADALTNLGITLDDRRVAQIYRESRKFACLDAGDGAAAQKKRASVRPST